MKFFEDLAEKLWGPLVTEYRTMSSTAASIDIGHYPGDKHEMSFTLHVDVKTRQRGPEWARKPHLQGYIVSWKCDKGIPVGSAAWDGESTHGSWVRINDPDNWFEEAVKGVHRQVTRWRIDSNFDDRKYRRYER